MEIEAKSENKRLNALVATTVVLVSVFLAISKLKDDNLVRSMEYTKADSVDVWNEYQAERIKMHNDENALYALKVVKVDSAAALAAETARLNAQIAKYEAHAQSLAAKARAADQRYGALAFRHDQFDMEDGVLSITLALTAVAALTEIYWLLGVAWAFAALGFVTGIAGMLAWSFHPEFLTRLIG